MKKYYVLDTNILLQNPNAIFGFEDNVVVITGTTLQELDSKKNMEGSLALMHVFDIKKPDNRIISSCVGISKK